MGTNYYLEAQSPCTYCDRPYPERHIGKSSAGWCFSLRVYPEDGIANLTDWVKLFASGVIHDEYGRAISIEELLDKICGRRISTPADWSEETLRSNHAVLDESGSNLIRACETIDVVHGIGTWDCIGHEFS